MGGRKGWKRERKEGGNVDFNTVQVTNIAQLHSVVFEDCHQPYYLRGNFCRMEAQHMYVREEVREVVYRNVNAISDVSYDVLLTALELSALQPWSVRPARE